MLASVSGSLGIRNRAGLRESVDADVVVLRSVSHSESLRVSVCTIAQTHPPRVTQSEETGHVSAALPRAPRVDH